MRVLDVGCGPGIYVDALREAGVDAVGVDLDPRSPHEICDIFSSDFVNRHTSSPTSAKPYDLTLCLEVAEHLPENLAAALVARLVGTSDTILFSAAVPGQGGHGHINCQPKEYWLEKFARHNYVLDDRATDELVRFMVAGYHLGWFVSNTMVLRPYGLVYYSTIIEEETEQAVRLAQYLQSTAGLTR